jgi:glycosyltransferase involved in cell wall biosynthesis
MAMEPITAQWRLGLKRGAAVVCIPVGAGDDQPAAEQNALATVRSVIEHTDTSTALLIVGSAEGVESIARGLSDALRERVILTFVTEAGASKTQMVNSAADASVPADLVLVVPGVRVAAGWLEALRAAARSDSTVATATPLSLGADGVELQSENGTSVQLDGADELADRLDELAALVAKRALGLRPRLIAAGPGCAYIRRETLELVGPLDDTLPLDRALPRLSVRAIAAGMVHVAADEVLVAGSSNGSAGAPARGSDSAPGIEEELSETLLSDEHGSLQRAIGIARMALRGLSVTIDGRALSSAVGGTQTYMIELIMALAREPDVALRVLVAHDLSERAATALASVSGEVELLSYEQALERPGRTDVVHRPQPVFTADDMTLLQLLGERVVIGQLDLIAYHNHSYHRDLDDWRAYRRTTRLALGGADQVVFFSEHARRDALAEDLLPAGRTHMVSIGAEVLESAGSPSAVPQGFGAGDPFLLCLGADYAHKNRPFAIELLGALRELGWLGRLVLAGAHVSFGSSRERERELLESKPELAECVVDLGPVDESSKQWLFTHARALVYPTLYEGFGLLPLEAARADLACLFAAQASLSEVAPEAATLLPWDAQASATAVLPLLVDGPAREQHIAQLHALSVPTWSEASRQLLAVYRHAVQAPPSEAATRIWQELDRETTAQRYHDAYYALEARVATGLPLIDEGGLLNHAQQRGLMRVAARRRLGAVLLAPLDLLGRRAAPKRD